MYVGEVQTECLARLVDRLDPREVTRVVLLLELVLLLKHVKCMLEFIIGQIISVIEQVQNPLSELFSIVRAIRASIDVVELDALYLPSAQGLQVGTVETVPAA